MFLKLLRTARDNGYGPYGDRNRYRTEPSRDRAFEPAVLRPKEKLKSGPQSHIRLYVDQTQPPGARARIGSDVCAYHHGRPDPGQIDWGER